MSGGKKPVIGIVGGIGSGKSTVASQFAKLGCAVIDADALAREAMEKEAIAAEIIKIFGPQIADESGKIDRSRLAKTAFSDAEKLKKLNSIIHPLVLTRMEQLLGQYQGDQHVRAIVLDVPLLVEVGWHERCDRLVFVDADEKLRAQRAKNKGLLEENEIKMREKFQICLDKKKTLADNVIDNNSDSSALLRQVAEILSYILNNS